MPIKYENIFVLCTGRCGSTTFAKAFSHAEGYTCGHETRSGHCGSSRLDYPKMHIEVDNRLSWLLGRLDKVYGKRAFYIHLSRERRLVANSLQKRISFGIMQAYSRGILMGSEKTTPQPSPIDFSNDYIETVNDNISLFLKDKPFKTSFSCENGYDETEKLWNLLELEGDMKAAQETWKVSYNAS